jgi:hypothetical protein
MRTDPSALQLIGLVLGSVGLGYTIYGRKQSHAVALGCGVLLMMAPFAIGNVPALLLTALTLMALPFLLHRLLR